MILKFKKIVTLLRLSDFKNGEDGLWTCREAFLSCTVNFQGVQIKLVEKGDYNFEGVKIPGRYQAQKPFTQIYKK